MSDHVSGVFGKSIMQNLFECHAPLIGGAFLEKTSHGQRDHINPSTGQSQAKFLLGGTEEIELAVASAQQGAKVWRALGGEGRRDVLVRWAGLVERDAEILTLLSAHEHGAPRVAPLVQLALGWMRYYAGWADKIEGATVDVSGGAAHAYTLCEPYGVIGAIIPWNGPLVATCMKAVPALAAGNAVVLKPPSLTPFIALRLGALALEAGMPPGVFNVVPGDADAGEALVRHPGVSKISFTGGGSIARKVAAMAGEVLKPVALELGGKSANLIFADADLDSAAQMALFMSMGLSGQGCVLPTRVYVADDVHDALVARITAMSAAFNIGNPADPEVNFGPVISAAAADRIMGVIARAHEQGGTLACGGDRLGGDLAGGNFIAPTVFCDVAHDSDLAREEVFGPVLAIMRFSDEADAVAKANDTRFGLGAYVHTNNLARAHRMASALHAGVIGINSGFPMSPGLPFGGKGESGYGREGGKAGLDEFLQQKSVYIPLAGGFM